MDFSIPYVAQNLYHSALIVPSQMCKLPALCVLLLAFALCADNRVVPLLSSLFLPMFSTKYLNFYSSHHRTVFHYTSRNNELTPRGGGDFGGGSDFHYKLSFLNTVLPQGPKITAIQCWSLAYRDFSGFSAFFNDPMNHR